ncbi:UNVERIFIED_CONTAM: hypothetical protein Sradi_5760800 [Sesamum radiatum]|uniref:Reverse transcriptase domain-containing protein n=1 Tax=Sesamum radiatum TaxID=300843 RepID=A0AAW2L5M1_SESRA
MSEETRKEIVLCLQRNADIFAWTPQDLEGIGPRVITHYLNIDPSIKPVKWKKRHFRPEKDKIIRMKVDKLMRQDTLKRYSSPNGYPMLSSCLNLGGNGECVLISGILTKHALKISIPYHE